MLEVKPEDLSPEEQKALDVVLDKVVSVVVFHKRTLEMAGQDVRVRDIPSLVRATLDKYKQDHLDRAFDHRDFALIRVDFETKNISLQGLEN